MFQVRDFIFFGGLNFTSIHPQCLSVSLAVFLSSLSHLLFVTASHHPPARGHISSRAFVAQQWSLITTGVSAEETDERRTVTLRSSAAADDAIRDVK